MKSNPLEAVRRFLDFWRRVPRLEGMSVRENLQTIDARIQAACERSGRNRSEVLLLPVSKGHSAEAIGEAADLGLRIFGESKVQEAKLKVSQCSSRLSWHMIGHLQSNKCRDAVQLFSMIHSVDSVPLAHELNKWAEKLGRRMPILLEVNVAGESTKHGFKPEEVLPAIEEVNALPRLEIQGLMTIAP
jgi:PLP dependent protein